ncbi:P4b precursor [Sea otter poxvirus]|uniref:Virion core protein 4b n=1 Tax=Sea otter poxvirus TaxID=1416741 RepID=A0A2U9QHT6_9POXV|nr:P4b precursor [Sea otter poxvirus]AWU47137.1 P4b precursor [Sea otter poxvirus]
MDCSNSDCLDIDVFLNSKINLEQPYNNQYLSLVNDRHIHVADSALSCSVCNMLSYIASDTHIAGGAPRPKIKPRKQNIERKKDDACRPSQPTNNDMATIPIDEIASTHEWMLRLRKDGDKIASYIRHNKCNINNFTIHDMLSIMDRLNIARRDRTELFELMGHVKSSLTNANLSVKTGHPLLLIYSRANSKITQQIREMEQVYEPSNYQSLITTSRFQSSHFVDMSSSNDLLFCFKSHNSTGYINPILVALFGSKIAALENTFINGDTFSLLHQLFEYRRVQPENYMLLVNRLTEDSPIIISGINDVISTEVQRANLHAMIRKTIMNLRMGIFHCTDDESLDQHLMKIIHTGCSTVMSDEEQTLASILAIVGFKPVLVSVTKGTGCDLMLQSTPYVVIDTMRMITTSTAPIDINTKNVFSLAYDGGSGRVMFAPPNISYRPTGCSIETFPTLCAQQQMIDRLPQPPIIVNGAMIFLIERRTTRSTMGEYYTGYRSMISDTPINVSQELIMNGIPYRLKSAVCYRTGDNAFETCSAIGGDSFLTGHYAIVFTEHGPWMYDPLSILSKQSREARMMRAIKHLYRQEVGNDDESNLYEWMRGDGASLVSAKQAQLMNNTAVFEDDLLGIEEAMTMISRQCCVLVYAQDYGPYISSRSIGDAFWF